MANSISCDTYDYIEVACLYRYEVKLTLFDGRVTCGQAQTTTILPNKIEAIQLSQNDELIDVALSDISIMEVTTPHARFSTVDFST